MVYDSRVETLEHSRRVGELIHQLVEVLLYRSTHHDLSKTESPEVEVFDLYTPKLKGVVYGSEEYRSYLTAMGDALAHHYKHNPHHPEHHQNGVNDMTLVDLIEMLADWKAATERHDSGSLSNSLIYNKKRFGISDQLQSILVRTATEALWL